MLLQHAQDGLPSAGLSEQRMLELLLREIQKSEAPRQKALGELQQDLQEEPEGQELWAIMIARLREIDSPDALFDTFHGLGASIARDFSVPCALHASGIFGHFARRCVLAFKDASFEASVKLYDAVREYVAAFDAEEDNRIMPAAHSKVEDVEICGEPEGSGPCALGTSQMDALARNLMQDLPLSFGRVSFLVIDKALATLQGKLPLCHVVHFLRYVNSLQHRLADDAGTCLRSFHDGHQQRGLAELRTASGWPLGVPSEDGLPDLIQYASLALAGLHSEMRHLDDALQAIGESIRASQEASDGGCLCACLYMLSLALLQEGHSSKAFAMMRRCLHRAESLGLPMLQSFCCLGIARVLSLQPALSDRRKRGLLWRESISRMSTDMQAAPATVLRVHGTTGGAAAAGATWAGAASGLPRIFAGAPVASRGGGLGVLATMLGQTPSEEGSRPAVSPEAGQQGNACRDALAHATLASQLSTWAGPLNESRPKVLLCQAAVAREFGLQPLTATSCKIALDVYHEDLSAEDRAIALCQLASAAADRSLAETKPLWQGLAQELPHASHLWAHAVGPCVVMALLRSGEAAAAAALLFQVAGMVRAVPHDLAASAAQQLRLAANGVRLYTGHLLAAYRSARGAVESGAGTPGDVCSHLLCLTDVHLQAQDPIGALTPCLRCISAAESARLLHFRAEALVRLARIKLEMRDLVGAMQLAEEATPQLSASNSAKLKGEALMIQTDVLFALLARQVPGAAMHKRLLREIVTLLEAATAAFKEVAELNSLRRGYYLLARVQHELGNTAARNHFASAFRMVSSYLSGQRTTWQEEPVDASVTCAAGLGKQGASARPAISELISLAQKIEAGGPGSSERSTMVGAVHVSSRRSPEPLGEGVATVVGVTKCLYPLASVLGA